MRQLGYVCLHLNPQSMKAFMSRIVSISCILLFSMSLQAQESGQEYYQLKIYSFDSEAQEGITDSYLKDAYIPALKRQDISHIGVFKLRPNYKTPSNKTFVLIPFSSLEQFVNVEAKLASNTAYLNAGKEYLEASHEQAPYSRIESILMRAFKDMPKMKPASLEGDRKERVYELRSYESPNETYYKRKVHMFNEGGEISLFESLGFNAVFYAEVISGGQMPNLMYMTTFENRETRDALWKEFFNSEKWGEISVIPKYQKTVSHADIMFLYPTAYSDY